MILQPNGTNLNFHLETFSSMNTKKSKPSLFQSQLLPSERVISHTYTNIKHEMLTSQAKLNI